MANSVFDRLMIGHHDDSVAGHGQCS